jgi:hypothetical protein
MSPKTKVALSLDEQRSRLERRANVIRSRLLRTIDALDNRRHQVQEIGHHAKRLAMPVGAAFAGIVIATAATTFGVRALVRRRRERSFGYRLSQALAPLRREQRPPFWQEALRKVALTALGILASELTKRGAHGLIVGRGPRALLGPAPAPHAPTPLHTTAPVVATANTAPLLR